MGYNRTARRLGMEGMFARRAVRACTMEQPTVLYNLQYIYTTRVIPFFRLDFLENYYACDAESRVVGQT